jgi:hypothetical protein
MKEGGKKNWPKENNKNYPNISFPYPTLPLGKNAKIYEENQKTY